MLFSRLYAVRICLESARGRCALRYIGPARNTVTWETMRSRAGSAVGAHIVIVAMAIVIALGVARPAAGYSVLAHEANIDALWDATISRMLMERFPGTTPDELLDARAYAYGGSVIQDLGYYPFGSHFFSN